jgi:hypothetical protein
MNKAEITEESLTEEKNLFFHQNLHYFEDSKKLITIKDDAKVIYKIILTIGSIIFIVGLFLVFLAGSTDFGIFFLFFSFLFLIKGLPQYLSYRKYKELPLTLYNKNLKLGKTLRAYVRVDSLVDNKNFTIQLKNEYVYEIYSGSGNSRRKRWNRNTVWSYKTKGYVKVEEGRLYIYFEIPIDNDASATKNLRDNHYNLKRKHIWTLTLKEDSNFFPLSRDYEIKIRK